MPNWCDNTITFANDVEDNYHLIYAFQQDNPFESICPCPPELDAEGAHSYGGDNRDKYDEIRKQLKETYGYENGYDWRVANWGTKWDASEVYGMDDHSFSFNTAWGPPTDLYRWIAKNHPGARFDFTYEEGGVGFEGEGTVWDGEFNYEIRDFVYAEDPEDVPAAKATSNVGAATILPLPREI
jgi:hypothetical protein